MPGTQCRLHPSSSPIIHPSVSLHVWLLAGCPDETVSVFSTNGSLDGILKQLEGKEKTSLPWWQGPGKGEESADFKNKKAPTPDLGHLSWERGGCAYSPTLSSPSGRYVLCVCFSKDLKYGRESTHQWLICFYLVIECDSESKQFSPLQRKILVVVINTQLKQISN